MENQEAHNLSQVELMGDYSIDRDYLYFDNASDKEKIKKIFLDIKKDYIGLTPSPSLSQGKIIVACGRGYHADKGYESLCDICKILGANLAGTRPLQDLSIFKSNQILGKTALGANPDIYIGFGVSGSIQHLGNVKAKKIIAINNNKNSAIFRHCSYAIIGDARQVSDYILQCLSCQN